MSQKDIACPISIMPDQQVTNAYNEKAPRSLNGDFIKAKHNWKKNIKSYWCDITIIVAIFLIIFIVSNCLIGLIYYLKDRQLTHNPGALHYGIEKAKQAYPNLNIDQIRELLLEHWSGRFRFEYDFALHKYYSPYHGTYINVEEPSYRWIKNQGPWPPDPQNYNIFVFGGSTTFGSGVSDKETIPSYLQEYLRKKYPRVAVYNFGVGGAYSTVERELFEKLITTQGIIPNSVIFIDGLNDFDSGNSPEKEFIPLEISANITRLFLYSGDLADAKIIWQEFKEGIKHLPIYRFAQTINRKLSRLLKKNNDSIVDTVSLSESNINMTINRYVMNIKIVESTAERFHITPIFVWQPIPQYKYDKINYLFGGQENFSSTRYQNGYKIIENYETKQNMPLKNFIDLSGLQEDERNILYIDEVHYSPYFNNKIAKKINDMILSRNYMVNVP